MPFSNIYDQPTLDYITPIQDALVNSLSLITYNDEPIIVETSSSIDGLYDKHDDYFPRLELILMDSGDEWAEQKTKYRTLTWSLTGYALQKETNKDLYQFYLQTCKAVEKLNGDTVQGLINIPFFIEVNDQFNAVIDTHSDDKLKFFILFFTSKSEV